MLQTLRQKLHPIGRTVDFPSLAYLRFLSYNAERHSSFSAIAIQNRLVDLSGNTRSAQSANSTRFFYVRHFEFA